MEYFYFFTAPLAVILVGSVSFMTYKICKEAVGWLDKTLEDEKKIKEKVNETLSK